MAVSAKKQVTQSASEAAQAVDARKEAANKKATRPNVIARGHNISVAKSKIMFDNVPNGFRCANQINMCIDAYFDLLPGENHEPISIQAISDKADLVSAGFAQDGVSIIVHYKKELLGLKDWNYRQGKVKIASIVK